MQSITNKKCTLLLFVFFPILLFALFVLCLLTKTIYDHRAEGETERERDREQRAYCNFMINLK